jgi:hypothetical protein
MWSMFVIWTVEEIENMIVTCSQQAPVILAGNKEQQKKYLGPLVEDPLVTVSMVAVPCVAFVCCILVVVLHYQ